MLLSHNVDQIQLLFVADKIILGVKTQFPHPLGLFLILTVQTIELLLYSTFYRF